MTGVLFLTGAGSVFITTSRSALEPPVQWVTRGSVPGHKVAGL